MIGTAAFGVKSEQAFRRFAHQHLISNLQLVKLGSECALGNQFEEKFQLALERRGHDGVSAFDPFYLGLDAESCVLPRLESECAARINPNHPQIESQTGALYYF